MGGRSTRPLILGYGEMPSFSPYPGRSALDAASEASLSAVADAKLDLGAIDGVVAGNPLGNWSMFGTALSNYLGLKPAHCTTISLGGASGAGAVARAAALVQMGVCDAVLAVYADARASSQEGQSWQDALGVIASAVSHSEFEQPFGLTAAAAGALMASERLHSWGTDESLLIQVARSAREYAAGTVKALIHQPLDNEIIARSPMVAEPLRGYDCALVSDFGGAVIVAAPSFAARTSSAVHVLGAGEATFHKYLSGADQDFAIGAQASSGRAYVNSGIRPAEVDVVQLYDAFTIYIPILLEELGFCDRGSAGDMILSGGIALQGETPCNTNGGMLAYAHGGSLHVTEAIRQLRGEAEKGRQVDRPAVALVHGIGGTFSHHVTLLLGV